MEHSNDTASKVVRFITDSIETHNLSACTTSPPYKWKARPLFARFAFFLSGGSNQYEQTKLLNPSSGHWMSMNLLYTDSGNNPLHQISAEKQRLCVFTHQDSVLNAITLKIPGRGRWQHEKIWVNYLLGNFFFGDGPENIYFPPESKPSGYLAESRIVQQAIRQFYRSSSNTNGSVFIIHSRFGVIDLMETAFRPLSIKHFTGSAAISISHFNDSLLLITVLNITSLTSADYTTHYKKTSRWPQSIPRQYHGHPLSNTCQIYHILVPQKQKGRKD